jgi:YggT family protein
LSINEISIYVTNFFFVYRIILFAYILSSWVPPLRNSGIGRLLGTLSEPYLTPFRKIIPPIGGMLDLSPIVALIALSFVEGGVIYLIRILLGA